MRRDLSGWLRRLKKLLIRQQAKRSMLKAFPLSGYSMEIDAKTDPSKTGTFVRYRMPLATASRLLCLAAAAALLVSSGQYRSSSWPYRICRRDIAYTCNGVLQKIFSRCGALLPRYELRRSFERARYSFCRSRSGTNSVTVFAIYPSPVSWTTVPAFEITASWD